MVPVQTHTQLFHAFVPGGPTGISFTLGHTKVFAPLEDDRLIVITPDIPLQITDAVAGSMIDYLVREIIEPRLYRLVDVTEGARA